MKKPKGVDSKVTNKINRSKNQINSKPKVWKKTPKQGIYNDMNYAPPPEDTEKWYSSLPPEPKEFPSCPMDKTNQLKEEAKQMLSSEASAYNIKVSKSSEQSWMRSVMAKGTGKDKIAAFTLMVQDKPLFNLAALQSLVGFVKPGKKECLPSIETLVELFISDLLPPDTKLKRFAQRPLMLLDELSSGNPAGRRRRLTLWYFEEQLKEIFREFIDSLRVISTEAVEASKERAVKALATLLESHPEQEGLLLSNVVNKMGDPSKKVASKSMLFLTHVLNKHPNMKGVIMGEVEKLLFRPNIGKKARYYGICFLSQIMFSRSDSQLAANIIKLYFSFFKACVKLGDVDSKMLSVLLSGVNRAYPFAKEAMDSIAEQLETLYKVVHIAPFHVSLQGLALLFQVSDYKNNVSDRFYSVLYRKILDPAVRQTSHAPMFLNLTFQALKKDESTARVQAFIKRLLQVCCYLPVPMICAILYMISQLLLKNTLLATSFGQKVKEEDVDVKVAPSEALTKVLLEDDSEDEHYEDVPLDEDDTSKKVEESTNLKSDENSVVKPTASWVHKTEGSRKSGTANYDPFQRNPRYANADLSCYSELCFLSQHYHPTVALFASQIIESELIKYSGDPLQDFTLMRFLERFSFKNPKKPSETPSTSLFAKRQNYMASGFRGVPVRSGAYLNQQEEKVPVEERYLFNYLQRRRDVAQDRDDADSDVESVGSDEFDDMLDDLMKKRGLKKDIDDDDDDDDYSDIDADVDFADEFSKTMSSNKSARKAAEEDGMSGSDNDDEDMDDEEMDDEEMDDEDDEIDDGDDGNSEDLEDEGHEEMSGDEDLDFGDIEDDDEEDIDFGDESENEDDQKHTKGKKKKNFSGDVFASAEEFSALIDAASNARDGGSGAVSNKDKAPLKQLDWEEKRDRWVKGYKNFTGSGKGHAGHKKGKPMGVKRPSFKANKKRRF